eukprot:GHVP01063610.1.p1 GENE.GHVP01063610.1~~GHVP01063610.1.p1  ORF type:complete len:147 (-),score=26.04 GHVP01063610.1:182-580(-)
MSISPIFRITRGFRGEALFSIKRPSRHLSNVFQTSTFGYFIRKNPRVIDVFRRHLDTSFQTNNTENSQKLAVAKNDAEFQAEATKLLQEISALVESINGIDEVDLQEDSLTLSFPKGDIVMNKHYVYKQIWP